MNVRITKREMTEKGMGIKTKIGRKEDKAMSNSTKS